jgi:hypothetical protein
MNEDLIARLQQFLFREDNESLVGKPATDEEIAAAELELGVPLDKEYIQFIKRFGGAYAGLSIHAFTNGSSIGRETVTELTKSFRADFMGTPARDMLNRACVISIDGSGDPIFLDSKGRVFICYHDTGESKILANSLTELIEQNFYEW